MLVALLTVHLRHGFFVPYGVEFVLTLFAACLALVGLGAGPWSLDERAAALTDRAAAPDRDCRSADAARQPEPSRHA